MYILNLSGLMPRRIGRISLITILSHSIVCIFRRMFERKYYYMYAKVNEKESFLFILKPKEGESIYIVRYSFFLKYFSLFKGFLMKLKKNRVCLSEL